MNLNINKNNLYLLLPSKVSQLAKIYAEDKNVSIIDALRYIYKSNTYKKLEDENTKLWHYGPVALYEILLEIN